MTCDSSRTHLGAAKLLVTAADRIEQCGLFQGEYWPINPGEHTGYVNGDPCCALGALAVAANFEDVPRADTALDTLPELGLAIDALAERIDSSSGREPAQISAWNDHPERTRLEVASALRAAAQQLRAQAPARPDDTASRTSRPSPNRQQTAWEVITNV